METDLRRVAAVEYPVLLVVGNLPVWQESGRILPESKGIAFIDFRELDDAILRRLRPDIVISALYGNGFDAVDIAAILAASGFKGKYRVIVDRIPKPILIRTEVRHIAPDIDFDVINLRERIDYLN